MQISISTEFNTPLCTLLFLGDKHSVLYTEANKLPSPLHESLELQIERYQAKKAKGIQFLPGMVGLLTAPLLKEKGLNEAENLRLTSYRSAKSLKGMREEHVAVDLRGAAISDIAAIVEGLYFAEYKFDRYKSKSDKTEKAPELNYELIVSTELLDQVKALLAAKELENDAIKLTRDLVNTPGGDLTPQIYTQIIKERFESRENVKVKIRTKQALTDEGYNGLLTVGRGSQNPPVLVTLNYEPQQVESEIHLGLVGKGITFDTGGISIKPSSGMWEMRMDMGGSATVIGAFDLITKLKLPIRVTAVVCLAENRPGENAVLPGDIFKAKNGKTVMVDNTDAEGRLVLTDGLYEAQAEGATHVLDLATLTGAIIRAIGSSMTGLFSNEDEFAAKIIESGKAVGEKLWHMPLEMEYRKDLDDKVADLCNIGGEAGAVTAALFLNEFVNKGTTWAHLDIAGTAFTTKDFKYYGWGATGWGVKTLTQLAENLK